MGSFTDATGDHGFLASPVPEPTTFALLVFGWCALLAKSELRHRARLPGLAAS